jgi:hypothetical protein
MSRDTEKKIKLAKRADALRGNLLKRKQQMRDQAGPKEKK